CRRRPGALVRAGVHARVAAWLAGRGAARAPRHRAHDVLAARGAPHDAALARRGRPRASLPQLDLGQRDHRLPAVAGGRAVAHRAGGSVPFLAQVASPLGALAAEALGRRKALSAALATASRLLWLAAAFVPQAVPAGLAPAVVVTVVFLAGCFQAANGTVWTAWMGDVVPEDRRGRYFGLRTGVLGVVGMLANLAAGAFLDRVAAPLGFQVVLVVGVACALVGVLLLLLHHDPPTERVAVRLGELLGRPFRERNFRRFLRFAVYWQFVVLLGAPFVLPYFLEELGMTYTQVAYWSSIAALTSLASTILWGRVADAAGNKAVLAIGTFLAGAMLPANWILAGLTGDLTFIWVSAFFDAVAWGAITPAIFNLALV